MKKSRNTSTKVVAISTVAVVALAGVSVVSLQSLARNDDAARAAYVGSMDADTASGKLAVRSDEIVPDVDVDVDAYNDYGYEDYGYYYEEPVELRVAVNSLVEIPEANLVVIEKKVEAEPAETEEPEEKKEETAEPQAAELKVAAQPVFLAAEKSVLQTPEEEEEPVLEVVSSAVDVFEDFSEEAVAEEPEVIEEVEEEPVREEAPFERFRFAFAENDIAEEEPDIDDAVVDVDADVEVDVDVDDEIEEYVEVEEVTTTTTSASASTTQTVSSSGTSDLRQALVDYAASRVGVTPYVWAGNSLETGTDCSGFVSLIYDSFGYYASAGSDDYQDVSGDWGTNISYDELQPGDVVVYYDGGHVGIYAGQDENGTDLVIHDSNEIDGVKISEMDYTTPTAYVRIIDDYDGTSYTSSYTDDDYDDYDYDESYDSDDDYDDYDDYGYGYEDRYYDYDNEWDYGWNERGGRNDRW